MILFPAIDLKGGACVRLLRGDMAKATTYNDDPAAQARIFAAAGAQWIHVVDLDGARDGRTVNAEAIRAIIAAVDVPVQLGGGMRAMDAIAHNLEAGAARIVLGTAAVREPALVREACRRFPERIAVAIDARDGKVAVEGWVETSEMPAQELARALDDTGVAAIIYTDIARDGALTGPNLDATAALARLVRTPVIASGGVGSLEDLRAVRALARDGVTGVICGRALYDGRIDLRDALATLEGADRA